MRMPGAGKVTGGMTVMGVGKRMGVTSVRVEGVEGKGGLCLSVCGCSPEVSPGGAHTHALYTPRGAPRVPQSMQLPVVPVDGTKALKTKHGLSEQSKGGRVRPKAPHQKAPNGGGTVCGARSAARLAPRAIRPEKPQRRVSRRQSSGRISPVGQQVLSLPLVHGEIVPAC